MKYLISVVFVYMHKLGQGDVKLFLTVKVKVLVAQLCLTLCNLMDCVLPGSPVHGILQARILEWAAILFSGGSYQHMD